MLERRSGALVGIEVKSAATVTGSPRRGQQGFGAAAWCGALEASEDANDETTEEAG